MRKAELDPRHQPFIEYSYEQFEFHREMPLLFDGSDVTALKRMLAQTKALEMYDLEHLKWLWLVFMKSNDRFDREQGHPMRYFCSNIQKFAARVNGNGYSAGTNAAREWLEGRLNGK